MPFNHPVSRETSINLSVIAVAIWLLSYAMVLAYFRQRTLKPDPATEDLREESPAVVSLLVNNFEPGLDLVEATLLDLGARGFLEFRPSESGRHTVHIGKEFPSGLSAFDQQVFDRVSGSAIGGVAQLERTVFDDLYRTAQREAREAGLSQLRFDWRTQSWLIVGAVAAAATVGGSLFWASGLVLHLTAGVLVLLALLGLIAAGQRVQHTPAGITAAQHWLGVRQFMRGHSSFVEDPPTAAKRWERYLGYGAAMGVTHGASLLAGDRHLIWAHHDGRWRRVRVEYPRGWDRYGRSVPDLLRQAGTRLAAGGALLLFWRFESTVATNLGLVAGAYLVLRGLYLVIRTLIDLTPPRTIAGEVLRIDAWRPGRFSVRQDLYVWRVPHVAYLVVDDGESDRLTAWALPKGKFPEPGMRVRIAVRPWSRRVIQLALVESTVWHSSSSAAPWRG
ncbi:DUF2207 family protein [Rhizocola hellebori]|uniref:DUF2207 family protein n=1 Tax=Rhizocola hellebori TaxID=1392758 RepID=UPI00194262FE|nr:DUF2207 domain-containing protein [Rhizocola hellebori]